MRFSRAASATAASVALAAILSGCVVFQAPPKAKQVGEKPKVKVKFTLCGSDNSSEEKIDCADQGNYDSNDPPDGEPVRVLLGFRVPKGTKAPQQFQPKSLEEATTAGEATTFTRNRSYKRELNQKAPRGQKYKYFGFSSPPFDSENAEAADFKVKFELPKDFDKPKFKVRPVVGFIRVSEAQPEDADVACGKDPFESPTESIAEAYLDGTDRICIDDPARDEMKSIKAKVELKKK